MSRKLFATTAVAVGSSAALLFSGIAAAEPAPLPVPAPIDGLQAPGLSAVQTLSPAVQQAAADPNNAASMLMAAASAFAGNSAASSDSQNLAAAVSQFVSNPASASLLPTSLPGGIPLPSGAVLPTPVPTAGGDAQHLPPAGIVPGAEAHLPPGVDPAHAVGPQPAPPEVPTAAAAPQVPTPAAPEVPTAAAAPEVPTIPVAHLPGEPVAAAPVTQAAAPAPEAAVMVEAGPAPAVAPAPAAAAVPPSPAAAAFGADAPPTQDFMYPSIGNGCLADGGNSIATAISVAGPAKIPTPGPGAGQTAYVFTAVGTAGPAEVQKLPLNVTWVNLSTGKSGSATLKPRPDINANGPTTLTAIVDTGSGSIISTIFGQVTTTEKQCQFMPTIGSTVVP